MGTDNKSNESVGVINLQLSTRSAARGVVVHGTFGELLQGYIYRKETDTYDHFLFSTPIGERWSRTDARQRRNSHEKALPSDFVLMQQMLATIEAHCHINLQEWIFTITSNIPRGKGMSSSTADIFSLGRIVQQIAPIKITDDDLRACARKIEYGDEILAGTISLCHQRRHELVTAYHTNMKLRIIGIDEGGEVKTANIHKHLVENKVDADMYQQLYNRLNKALQESDFQSVGHVSTISGQLFQKFNYHKTWDALNEISESYGALGTIVAHSGTVLGILLSEHDDFFTEKQQSIVTAIKKLGYRPELFTLIERKDPSDER